MATAAPRRQQNQIRGEGDFFSVRRSASGAANAIGARREQFAAGACHYDSSQGEQQPGSGHAPTGLLLFWVAASLADPVAHIGCIDDAWHGAHSNQRAR